MKYIQRLIHIAITLTAIVMGQNSIADNSSNRGSAQKTICNNLLEQFHANTGLAYIEIDADEVLKDCTLIDDSGDSIYLPYLTLAHLKNGELDQAIELISSAPGSQYPVSQYLIGALLEKKMISADGKKPAFFYERAAEHGFSDGDFRQGWNLEWNMSSRDSDTTNMAIHHYQKAVRKGSVKGHVALGLAFERGVGVDKNLATAVKKYDEAAKLGDNWSLIRLAELYQSNHNIFDEIELSEQSEYFISQYRRDADTFSELLGECNSYVYAFDGIRSRISNNKILSSQDVQRLLGAIDILGHSAGSIQNAITVFEAVSAKEKAAVMHLYELYLLTDLVGTALDLLGNYYLSNNNLDISTDLNAKLLETISNAYYCKLLNFPESPFRLAKLYDAGASFLFKPLYCLQLRQKRVKGENSFSDGLPDITNVKKSLARDHPISINYLGKQKNDLIENNNSPFLSKKNNLLKRESINLFINAALLGNRQATYNIAKIHRDQHSILSNSFDEFRWLFLSHKQGYPSANRALGYIFREIGKDAEAIKFFRLAAAAEDEASFLELSELLLRAEKNSLEGMYWWGKHAIAMFNNREKEKITDEAKELVRRGHDIDKLDQFADEYYKQRLNEYENLPLRFDNTSEHISKLESLIKIATTTKADDDIPDFLIRGGELKAILLAQDSRNLPPYFELLTRSCVYGNLSKSLKELEVNQATLFYAIRSVNLLQQARQFIRDIPTDVQECFTSVHEDRYRWLADLFVSMNRLQEAESVLSMLDSFKDADFIRDQNSAIQLEKISHSDQGKKIYSDSGAIFQDVIVTAKLRARMLEYRKNGSSLFNQNKFERLNKKYNKQLKEFKDNIAGLESNLKEAGRITEFNTSSDPRLAFSKTLKVAIAAGRKLDKPTAALMTFVLPNKTTVLLITEEGRSSHTWDIPAIELNRIVIKFRRELKVGTVEANTTSRIIYDNLLKPFVPILKEQGTNTLLVSLDRALGYVPIQAIHTGNNYLVEDFSFGLLSPNSLVTSTPYMRSRENWNGVGFGVSEAIDGLSELPAVEAELKEIFNEAGETQGSMPGKRWLNSKFTKEAIEKATYSEANVLHFATHFLIGENESTSNILLGNGDKISLKDFSHLYNFENISILALSACNTGLPIHTDNESRLESATRRIQQLTEANAVVGSLWPVADSSTAKFMEEFYDELMSSNDQTYIEALATVQRKFISGQVKQQGSKKKSTWHKPKFWAPFVISGAPYN